MLRIGFGIHPGERDEPGIAVAGHLVEQFLTDRAVYHLLHVRGIAEQKRQVENVEIIDHGPERADADARDLDGADLGLLDRLLFAAKLHRGEHLHAQPAIGRLFELLAEVLHRHHGWISGRMHVRRLEDELLLRDRRTAEADKRDDGNRVREPANACFCSHEFLPLDAAITRPTLCRERPTI